MRDPAAAFLSGGAGLGAIQVLHAVLPAANYHHVQPTDLDRASRLIGEGLAEARTALAAIASPGRVAA